MGILVRLILLAGMGAAVYFLVIKPKIDAKKAAPATPVAPPSPVMAKEEKGNFLGTGNDMSHGLRPLWKFSHEANMAPPDAEPVAYYGKKIEFWTGPDYDHLALRLTVADSLVRTPAISYDDLYKPESDVEPKGCVFHGAGGSLDTVCVLKFSGR